MATTLARQLAARVPEAKRHICEAIVKQEGIMDHSLCDQWEQLIIDPLSKLTSRAPLLLVWNTITGGKCKPRIRASLNAGLGRIGQ